MKSRSTEPTIQAVAARAGVPIATVSRVLNEKGNVRGSTAVRVRDAMAELGYCREEQPEERRSGIVVIVLPNLDNPFYSMIVKGIQVCAKGRGLDAIIYPENNVDEHARKLANLLRGVRASGQIVLSPVRRTETLDELDAVAPLVQCAEYNEDSPLPYVSVDDCAAAKSAVETLLQKGRRRIALINGPERYKYARQRDFGYREALRQAGLAIDPGLVFHVTEMGFDSSLAVARQLLLAKDRPDAILATSDMFAAAALKVANAEGVRVPQELSIIGFDNTFISTIGHPSIAAVNMPQFQLGYMACEVLADRMANPGGESKRFLLKTELVLRESV